MIPETNLDDVLIVTEKYYESINSWLNINTDKAFSQDVFGYKSDIYEKVLSVHHIGFVLFMMALTIQQEINISRGEKYYYDKFNVEMLRNYLQCLGVRDDVITGLIYDVRNPGIGLMYIEGEINPFRVF